MHIDRQGRQLLPDVVSRYLNDYTFQFQRLLGVVTLNDDPFVPRLHLQEPVRVQDFCDLVRQAQRALLALPEGGGDISDEHAPIVREALIWERLAVARRAETHRTRTLDPDLINAINEQLRPYDRMMKEPWLREGRPAVVPQLREYFPLALIEATRGPDSPTSRALDEKFHILQAPSLFHPDLQAARASGDLRAISCAVAYLDVDDFKNVNTEYGEPFVDRNILPRLMGKLEAHVYQRGFAYRFGGDEYAILLHNTSPRDATRFVEALREEIANLTFIGTQPAFRITVSIGLVVISSGCHLTGLEIEACAAQAKQFAKQTGKNRTAIVTEPWLETARAVEH